MKLKIPGTLSILLLSGILLYSQKDDPYSNAPGWYRPGHPLNPAEPAAIKTLPGFKVEKVLTVPEAAGSLTTMTVDEHGYIVVATQHQPGLYRLKPAPIGSGESSKLEILGGAARTLGWCQGLLYAFDSLYVTVSEKNEVRSPGVYRLSDTDKNGEYDLVEQILELDATGEHAAHNMIVGPDRKSLYLMCGNGTPVPEMIKKRRTVRTTGLDHLMPDGFESSRYTDGGWVVRMNPDGSDPELIAGGLRNSYDLAFNARGDLFTFDSDMEYDLGTPWYRPTRICQIVSGGEFGWRAGTAKWPEHYEDSVGPVVNVGPSSPTGVLFGYEAAFPEKYRKAFIVLDWTFATIYAVHLSPEGAGYSADFEIFASGVGLPLTDCVIGKDGALYFCVGGRRLGSAIYRIWYAGPELDDRASYSEINLQDDHRDLRLFLESYHGKQNPKVVEAVWPYLGSEDRTIRFAARIALESQPVDQWRSRVLAEDQPQTQYTALLALARQGNPGDLLRVLDKLTSVDLSLLSEEGLLVVLRMYELVLARGGADLKEEALENARSLRRLLPHASKLVNRELARVLCFLEDSSVIDPLLEFMQQDKGETSIAGAELVERNLQYGARVLDMIQAAPMVERMHHAQMLTWIRHGWSITQRKRYFEMVVEAMQTSQGGKGYKDYWETVLDLARAALTEAETKTLSTIWAGMEKVEVLPVPAGPGKLWEMEYLLGRIEQGFGKRDFENGKNMFAAAQCITCHAMGDDGGIMGPNLTSVGQRFTIRDLLDSTIHPSNAISDQYQLMIVALKSGASVSGRIVSRDSDKIIMAPNALKPTQTQAINNSEVISITPLPVSTMPPGLLNALNEEEVFDLIAYILSGGRLEHAVFQQN